jgi:tRNA A37 N6-isopentenylltransferase MiaA
MECELEQTVKSLLAELDHFPAQSINENQTRRSEILEEVLRLVAVSLEATQKAQSDAERGRWV